MAVKLWNSTIASNVGNSIFIDALGYIHVCGFNGRTSASDLFYAISTDGGANFTDGEGGGSGTYKALILNVYYPNAYPAIVVDSSNNVYIFYSDNNSQLYFFKKTSGTWGSSTIITGATRYKWSLKAEIDEDDNLIVFGGGDYYYSCHTSVDGGTNWIEEAEVSVGGVNVQDTDLCLGYNQHLHAIWYYSTSATIYTSKITKTEGSPDSWVVEDKVNQGVGSASQYANAIICDRDSETLWIFRSYLDGSTYKLQTKQKIGDNWGSWTTILSNVVAKYINFQVIRTYDNQIYLVYQISGTSTLYYVLWNGGSWSSQDTFLADATNCNIQQPNLLQTSSDILFTYKPDGANELWFDKFAIPVTEQTFIDIDEFTISDEITKQINLNLSDTIVLSDEPYFGRVDDVDVLSLSDNIFVNERPQRLYETDIISLSDAIDLSRFKSKLEEDTIVLSDSIELKLPLEFIHNKVVFLAQIIKNINNKFSMLKSSIIEWSNKIRFRKQGIYSCKNDFRMRASWQVPANGGVQSLGKEYVKVYIATVEQTDVDIDSINISKSVNQSFIATFNLGRAYDAIAPDIESVIEIRYGNNGDRTKNWLLFGGYITQITPTDNPEIIKISCEDEMWKQSKTRVYFQVGHLPYGTSPDQYFYKYINLALSTLGINVNFGGFCPQNINCWGRTKSETITDLITQSGNFGWFYKENGTPNYWRAGEGSIVTLEAQEIGKNLGLYQVLNHSFKSEVSNIINRFRVQMGTFVNGLNQNYQSYDYEYFAYQPTPMWDSSLEVLATSENELGYDRHHHKPENNYLYDNVFKKYKLSNSSDLELSLAKWTDRYAPRVEIGGGGFGWICSRKDGLQTDGFSIDYKGNGSITFNEPVFYYKLNDFGEKVAERRAQVYVCLYKKKLHVANNNPLYPMWFYTAKMGDYPYTNTGELSLSGLSIQSGGRYIDENGKTKSIPSWNDTTFAYDVANWELSKNCDEKIYGTINLTLDAVCFYNIDLSKRIIIPDILDVPLNIMNLSYNMSDFTVTIQLETARSYYRSVSIQSRGNDIF